MAGDELLHEAAVFPESPVRVPRFPKPAAAAGRPLTPGPPICMSIMVLSTERRSSCARGYASPGVIAVSGSKRSPMRP